MNETLFDNKPTNAIMATEPPAAPTPLTIYARAIESGVSPEALEKMAALCERWEANQAADAYGVALAKFQAACPQIRKERSIDLGGGKGPLYASLDDIMAVVKPVLADCGLSVTFSAGMTDGGQLTAKCLVRHGRHTEVSEVTLPVPTQMRVNDTQKMGAALSYAKRYALCAALNIVVSDEDRDGAGLCTTIDDQQLATLREWLEVSAANEAAYLKFLGVSSLGEIAVKDFPKALQALKDKAAKR